MIHASLVSLRGRVYARGLYAHGPIEAPLSAVWMIIWHALLREPDWISKLIDRGNNRCTLFVTNERTVYLMRTPFLWKKGIPFVKNFAQIENSIIIINISTQLLIACDRLRLRYAFPYIFTIDFKHFQIPSNNVCPGNPIIQRTVKHSIKVQVCFNCNSRGIGTLCVFTNNLNAQTTIKLYERVKVSKNT